MTLLHRIDMTAIIHALLLLNLAQAQADNKLFDGFTERPDKSGGHSFVENGDFSVGVEKWKLPSGFRWEGSGGRNGGGGLFYERSNASQYHLGSQNIALQTKTRYRFGAWMKTKNTKGSAQIAIQFFDEQNVFRGGKFIHGTTLSDEWQYIENVFMTPEKPMTCQVVLYLSKNDVGEAWFDDVILNSEGAIWTVNMIFPTHESIPNAGGAAWLGIHESPAPAVPRGGLALRHALVGGTAADQIGYHDVISNRVRIKIEPRPAGVYDLKITIADTIQRAILHEAVIPLTVRPSVKAPPNACVIDERGRAVVGGIPFLPIGLYCKDIQREDIKKIAEGPFNCIMPYASMMLRFTNSSQTQQPIAGLEVLDELERNKMKIIYSVKDVYAGTRFPRTSFADAKGEEQVIEKIVTAFRGHPSLLAWYVNDELPTTMCARIKARRREMNRLDPYHPTWSVLYQIEDLPVYSETSDIIGIDNYPIRKKSDRHMAGYHNGMQIIENMSVPNGVSSWVVPQAYNDGVYHCKDIDCLRDKYRDPTEEEMRSMTLLLAAGGAKGFIFYSYFDIFRPLVASQSGQRWKELCRVGSILSELAPFILSESDGPSVNIKTEQGIVIAKGFTDEKGRVRIVIAGLGPGKARAIIKVAGGGFRSQYGRCVSRDQDAYLFEGDDMCSDILSRGE